MSDVIISAENIGKCYTLDHQSGGGGYRKFSDTLIHTAKTPLRWLKAGSGKQRSARTKEEFWALKDVSFEIKRGEVVGIIGRNGAGKSTLLKILSRITEPTKGRITLDGRVASLLEVGTGFHPELSGRENIYLNGAILGMKRAEITAKFAEIVAFAEIERFLDTPVKRYSSGMYVRLAFAVAAHLEPEILIVDEVLAVGDAQFQAKCLGKMKDVASGGRTVLFVSHNMAAVNALCSTGILLSQGQVEQRGAVSDVINEYMRQGHRASDFQPNTVAMAHVTRCVVEAEDGSPLTTGFTNQGLAIKIGFRIKETIRGLRTGFTLSLADGTVLAVCTPEDEGVLTPEYAGEHEAGVYLSPNQLMKGTYQIGASMWNGISGEIYDSVDNIASFHLEAAKGRAYSSEFQRAGLVQLPVRWSF